MNCGALILAAGASTRLGQPKQLISFHSETLLDRSIRVAREATCSPIVVVLGAFEDRIRSECHLRDVQVVSHPGWAQGMGSSLARGVEAFQHVSSPELQGILRGILVMTCDMPAVTPSHLRSLAAAGRLTATTYAGRNGVPAYFPIQLIPELQNLSGDAGARDLLRSAASIPLPHGELDVDTPEDLARAQRLFA